MFALAEHAPALGLAGEAAARVADIAASLLPSPSHKNMHPAVVRAAQIARTALASRP